MTELILGLLVALPVIIDAPFDDTWMQVSSQSPSHRGDDRFAQDWMPAPGTSSLVFAAPIDGVVIQATWTCSSFGRVVTIWDRTRFLAVRFAHLENIGVAAGAFVFRGEAIGSVGRSGPAPWCGDETTGAPAVRHAHVVVYRGVRDVNQRPITGIDLGVASEFATPFILAKRRERR